MRRALPLVIVVFALAGMADSAYLALTHLRVMSPENAVSSESCPAGGCEIVEQSTEATVLGVPTALLGFAYFGFVLGTTLIRLRWGIWPLVPFIEPVLCIGLFFSGYLVWVLLFEIGIPCPFCLFAHTVNAAIVLLYAVSRRIDRPLPTRRGRWAMGHR